MKIKTLQHSQEIYNNIIKIDSEIIAIDKRINKLLEKTQLVKLSIEFEQKEKTEKILDEDGSLNMGGDMGRYFITMLSPFGNTPTKAEADTDNFNLDETEAIYVLSVLSNIKKDKRKIFIIQLRSLGFEI